jgi:hypothetical protein
MTTAFHVRRVLLSFALIGFVSCLHSTKTAYHDSFSASQLRFISDERNYLIENCTAEQIYLVVRHGARYPSHKQARKAASALENLKQRVQNVESVLLEVENTFKDKPDYGLTELGGNEPRQISARFKRRYPEIFSNLTVDKLDFKSSTKPRSYESGTNFTQVLFGQAAVNLTFDDHMLRGFDHCQKYVSGMKENKKSLKKEMNAFKASEHVERVIVEFKERHFIPVDHEVRIGNGNFQTFYRQKNLKRVMNKRSSDH